LKIIYVLLLQSPKETVYYYYYLKRKEAWELYNLFYSEALTKPTQRISKQSHAPVYNKRHGTLAYYPSVFEIVRFLNKDNIINAS
jgi:hypothetical protein